MFIKRLLSLSFLVLVLLPPPLRGEENPLRSIKEDPVTLEIGDFNFDSAHKAVFVVTYVVTNTSVVRKFFAELKRMEIGEKRLVLEDDSKPHHYLFRGSNSVPICAVWFPHFTIPSAGMPSTIKTSGRKVLLGDRFLPAKLGILLDVIDPAVWEEIRNERKPVEQTKRQSYSGTRTGKRLDFPNRDN